MNKFYIKMKFLTQILLFFLLVCLAISACNTSPAKDVNLLAVRQAKVQQVLNSSLPIITLENLDKNATKAQEVAINDPSFQQSLYDPQHKAYKNEIFQANPLSQSDNIQGGYGCPDGQCYQVEMYNYALNRTTIGIVNVKRERMIKTLTYPDVQPNLPEHLVDLAVYIANNSPEVQEALGGKPDKDKAIMERTKTALNKSRCERSMHLCVAPTYVVEPKALWAIVDLTDEQLVGTRWTDVGTTGINITERRLQNDLITEKYCEKENTYAQGDWSLKYMMTSSDGLLVYDVKYKGKSVIKSLKLVDWHVSYSNREGFGYSDAIGCPYFSSAAVVAVEAPKFSPLVENNDTVGFTLSQNYWSEGWPAPCNYNYQQKFEFYTNGSFRPAMASIGRGCGNDGIYRPILRIALAGDKQNLFEYTKDNAWQVWKTEKWNKQSDLTQYSDEGYEFKIATENAQYYIEPSRGQFSDGGRGDNAYFYLTKDKPQADEGTTDLPTLGTCCNIDYRQGPQLFINNENTENEALVMWYVPEIRNDNRKGNEYCWAERVLEDGVYVNKIYPCFAGPKFVMIN
ncbi:MAG: hypothetical protein R2798_11630 [Chitinophagales bacterium]